MNRRIPQTLAATVMLAFGSPAALSQRTPPAAAPPAEAAAPPVEKRFDIELDGGLPAREAITRIAEKLRHPVNVIFTGDSSETPLPALRLHQVTLGEFFSAIQASGQIEAANGRMGYGFAPVDGAPNIYTFSVVTPAPAAAGGGGLSPEVVTSTIFTGGQQAPPAPEKMSVFFDLSTVLNNKLTIEDVTTAIRTAWSAAEDGKEPPPEALKFHQETKLLIATGYPRRLETVSNIVKLLQERNQPSKDEKQREVENLLRQRDEVERHAARELSEAEAKIQRMTKKFDEADNEKEKQLRDLQQRIAELEIELAKRSKAN
jgi:hypothetical protein